MVLVLLLILGLGLVLESAMTLRAVKVLDHLLNVLLLVPALRLQAVHGPAQSSRLSSNFVHLQLLELDSMGIENL